jgi:hypothetical protein
MSVLHFISVIIFTHTAKNIDSRFLEEVNLVVFLRKKFSSFFLFLFGFHLWKWATLNIMSLGRNSIFFLSLLLFERVAVSCWKHFVTKPNRKNY